MYNMHLLCLLYSRHYSIIFWLNLYIRHGILLQGRRMRSLRTRGVSGGRTSWPTSTWTWPPPPPRPPAVTPPPPYSGTAPSPQSPPSPPCPQILRSSSNSQVRWTLHDVFFSVPRCSEIPKHMYWKPLFYSQPSKLCKVCHCKYFSLQIVSRLM